MDKIIKCHRKLCYGRMLLCSAVILITVTSLPYITVRTFYGRQTPSYDLSPFTRPILQQEAISEQQVVQPIGSTPPVPASVLYSGGVDNWKTQEDSTQSTSQITTYKDEISCILTQMRPFFNIIEKLRSKALKSTQVWVAFSNESLKQVKSEDKGLFDIIDGHRVETVMLSSNQMPACLQDQFLYNFTIGNTYCTHLQLNSIWFKYNNKNIYGMLCTENATQGWHTEALKRDDVEVGLPWAETSNSPHIPWSYLHVIRSGLVTPEGDIIVDGIKILIQGCRDYSTSFAYPKNESALPLYNEVFSVTSFWSKSFCHGNLDTLSRLILYLPFLKFHHLIKIHMENKPSFLRVLGDNGITADRLVYGAVRAHILYVPAGVPCHRPSFFNTHFLHLNLLEPLSHIAAANPRNVIILIQRSPSTNTDMPRYFRRHEEILTMLKSTASQYGLEVWVFPDNPLPDLDVAAFMFHRALVVVAPHGAGELNMLFSKPGTLLVEGLCWVERGLYSMFYRNLAHILGIMYHGVYPPSNQCEDVGPELIEKPILNFLQNKLHLSAVQQK